jgi:hypothetical protein
MYKLHALGPDMVPYVSVTTATLSIHIFSFREDYIRAYSASKTCITKVVKTNLKCSIKQVTMVIENWGMDFPSRRLIESQLQWSKMAGLLC